MQALEVAAAETAAAWEQAATAAGAVREIIGGVAAPFLERMLLVCQDLPTGYLVLEAMADDRTWATRCGRSCTTLLVVLSMARR